MPLDKTMNRILALDLRTLRLGFAVLEAPGELLEWGTRRWRPANGTDPAAFIRRRIASLIKLYEPAIIVVKRASRQGGGRNSKQEGLLDTIMEEARRRSVKVELIARREVRAAFAANGQTTKHAIASHIALLFPELSWKLPPSRKAWSNEPHVMTIFDALSVGLTHVVRSGITNGDRSQKSKPN